MDSRLRPDELLVFYKARDMREIKGKGFYVLAKSYDGPAALNLSSPLASADSLAGLVERIVHNIGGNIVGCNIITVPSPRYDKRSASVLEPVSGNDFIRLIKSYFDAVCSSPSNGSKVK